MKGVLVTYQDNSMSLSCKGEVIINKGIIQHVSFKGYPRVYGDGWTAFYMRKKKGDKVTQKEIDNILSFNGILDVVSMFEIKK